MDWTTAAGTGPYPGKCLFSSVHLKSEYVYNIYTFTGFALAALLNYKNLESSLNTSFGEVKECEKNGADSSCQVMSKVVSVVVSNPSTQKLSRAVNITFRHLKVVRPVLQPL